MFIQIFQTWPNLKESFLEYFVTFPMDARLYQRPVTSVGTKHIKVKASPKKTQETSVLSLLSRKNTQESSGVAPCFDRPVSKLKTFSLLKLYNCRSKFGVLGYIAIQSSDSFNFSKSLFNKWELQKKIFRSN